MFKSLRSSMKGPGFVSEASPDFDEKADDRTKAAVEAAKRTMNKTSEEVAKELGATPEIKAKYKIEVRFMKGRTTHGPNLCGIMIWESGRRFHGGGDDKMYFCKDVRPESQEGCWGPISSDFIKGGAAYCPNCKKTVNAAYLTDMRIFRATTRVLSEKIEQIFRQLDSNADIYVKYDKDDIHYKAMERSQGPDVVRRLRGLHIYPLKNIVKDTAFGADLAKRFFAFLTS